jgi:hypothetical protein
MYIILYYKNNTTMSASPALANAGRYPAMPSASLRAILAAQYGEVPTSEAKNTDTSMNAPPIVDPHHDIEAPGAHLPATPSAPMSAILAAMYADPNSLRPSQKETCTPPAIPVN